MGEEHDPKVLGRDLRLKLHSFPELSGTYLENPGKGAIVEGELESTFTFAERPGESTQVFECTAVGATEAQFYLKPVMNDGKPEGFDMSYPSLPKMAVTFVYPKARTESKSKFSKFMSRMDPKMKKLTYRMNSTRASPSVPVKSVEEETAEPKGVETHASPEGGSALPPKSPARSQRTKSISASGKARKGKSKLGKLKNMLKRSSSNKSKKSKKALKPKKDL